MAILNHRDYRLAKARKQRLEKAIGSAMSVEQLATNLSNDAILARKSALQTEFQKVQSEIDSYERLQSLGDAPSETVDTAELGLLPILGRIKQRLSQRQLAEALGLKEQQIQRYESERYAGISLKRFEEILAFLAINVSARFEQSQPLEQSPPVKEVLPHLSAKIIKDIDQRQWFSESQDDNPIGTLKEYIERGLRLVARDPSYRRSLVEEQNFDRAALLVWQARIASEAERRRPSLEEKFDFSDMSWLSQLVGLSRLDDGPRRGLNFLAGKGIVLVVEPHFDNTYLDGAAFLLPDRTPVIGMTLRHDRIDNFWFTLLHELGHIFLHYNKGLEFGFVDDLDVGGKTEIEREADGFARSALVPDKIWNTAPARFATSIDLVNEFAEACGIHSAVVVGRMQYERKDYKLFRSSLGQGQVRKLFRSGRND